MCSHIAEQAAMFLDKLALVDCELSVAIVGDCAIRSLNRKWRSKDKSTDVLSFPLGDSLVNVPGPRLLGDIVISLDTAQRQARRFKKTVENELARYLAHGLLHLIGYSHARKKDKQKMAAMENMLLGCAGMLERAAVGFGSLP